MANNPTYEEYDPSVEWIRGAEVDIVKIILPGFKEEDIRVLMDNHGIIAVRGKRPIAGTRWSRFQKDFKVPDNCNAASMLISKFQNETLTITFPKETPKPPASP